MESIKRTTQDENPMEFWSARDLMPMLGYSTWRQFSEAIDRAKNACKISGHLTDSHFLPAPAKSSDFLTSVDKVIESKQHQITQAETWKKGLMQGLFV